SATSSADTRTVSAAVKIIRYLKPYEKLALEDLAPYVTETNFANHRR
ncbi:MAG: hypothetical protein HY692_06095, partial [Cyanobacteria bacterium NC_groundwater_1444_Ag_S-0.65um_54_12]|nr:hypothetical protein [Cyanobacteria bacterium NC_groundwater_1444_Ag_S-0.65um_54_12]